MRLRLLICALIGLASLYGCGTPEPPSTPPEAPSAEAEFAIEADRFADIRVLRYRIPGWESLSLQQRKLLYFLTEAGMSGRDIMWDQNYRHNLRVRRTLEEIVRHYPGDRTTADWNAFMTYAKQVWFANGIHHHYAHDKFTPGFSVDYFRSLAQASAANASWPLDADQTLEQLLEMLVPILFDPAVDARKTVTAADVDKVSSSAVNFYSGVTEAEVAAYYEARRDSTATRPISWGLNSTLAKENGAIVEKVWKVGGKYTQALERVVYWLEQAITVAEDDAQRRALELLVKYYRSGDLADFDAYNIAWVEDTASRVDAINGFIEVYNDPLGMRGSFESVVSFTDEEATGRIGAIASNAQWFEDNSPIMADHKKANVTGITGKVITVVSEAGDASPASMSGINLPNSGWIRAEHGSKSVVLANIRAANDASPNPALEEFASSAEEVARSEQWAELGGNLFVDMHEVIGHASGVVEPEVATPTETLKQYYSPLEEGRADLVALYYLMDPKLIEIGVMPSLDVGKQQYDAYFRNGLLTQLYRIEPGKNIEEAHMRNRQMISAWVLERAEADKAVERVTRDSETFIVVHDYERVRELFGELLREVQRIKSEGDFAAGQALIESYGTVVDPAIHAEVLRRYETLDVKAFSGFINPVLVPVRAPGSDEITDVVVEYPDDFAEQMLDYATRYSFLPTVN